MICITVGYYLFPLIGVGKIASSYDQKKKKKAVFFAAESIAIFNEKVELLKNIITLKNIQILS